MTAVITASRWHAIHPDYKSGSPEAGTAGILRLTTDLGTVLVPTEVVDRPRLFAFGPLVATPGALAGSGRRGCRPGPAARPPRCRRLGFPLCRGPRRQRRGRPQRGADPQRLRHRVHPPVDHHRRRDRRPPGPFRRPPPLRHHPAPADRILTAQPSPPGQRPHHKAPFHRGRGLRSCPFHRLRRTCTQHSTPVHQRVPSALRAEFLAPLGRGCSLVDGLARARDDVQGDVLADDSSMGRPDRNAPLGRGDALDRAARCLRRC